MNDGKFRNQRTRFINASRPYADKPAPDVRSGLSPRGRFPSRKTGTLVCFWTKQEYDAVTLLEAFPSVASYRERPVRLMLRDGPRWHAYVPHFMATLADDRRIAVELSTDGQPRGERQRIVADLVRRRLAADGIRLVELAHWMVRARPRSIDALKLVQPLLVSPSQAELLRAHDALDDGPAPLSTIVERSGVAPRRLLAMVRNRDLILSGPGPVDRTTLLARPDQVDMVGASA